MKRRFARRLRASQHVVKRSLMTYAHISALPLLESSHLRGSLLIMEQTHEKALRAAFACFTTCRQAQLDDLRAHQCASSAGILPLTWVPPYNRANACKGASRGVCVLHKESSHLRGSLLMKSNTWDVLLCL